jgi:pectin methylesterase-like acyl-CoA thioesterase
MTTRTRTRSNHFAIPAAALLLHACATDESGCEMPPVTGAAVYVSAQCGAVDGDGSKERPLSTLAAAVAKAKPGTTIAVAAGTYAETVSLPSGVTLTGMGASQVIIAPPADVGIRVAGAELTTIAGVTVQGARGTGIEVKGGKLLLQSR